MSSEFNRAPNLHPRPWRQIVNDIKERVERETGFEPSTKGKISNKNKGRKTAAPGLYPNRHQT
jgi:hypothetical protein